MWPTPRKKPWSFFKKNPTSYDALITDMTMPKISGEQIAAHVLEARPDMIVFILTGYSERINKKKVLDMGVRQVLIKPVSLMGLSNILREALDEKNTH